MLLRRQGPGWRDSDIAFRGSPRGREREAVRCGQQGASSRCRSARSIQYADIPPPHDAPQPTPCADPPELWGQILAFSAVGPGGPVAGDLELAEQCYRECLAIDEAEGAWTEVALDYGELGNVRAEQGLPEEAVPLMVRALSLNQHVKSDNAVLNITALRQQRAALGDEEFTRLLGRHFDEASVSAVLSLAAMVPTTGGRSGQAR